METIAKLIKAIFFGEDGEVAKSTTDKIKDFLLILFIVEHLLVGAMFYWVDDEEGDSATTELVDD